MHAKVQQIGAGRRAPQRRTVSEVLADVFCNLQDILRSEMRLRQAEAREELGSLRPAGTLITVGVLGGLLSAFFLLLAIVAALSLIISVWLAALIVALVMAVVCAVLLRRGVSLMRSRAEKVTEALEERSPWTGPPIA
jgi:Flp pilus assembly protein TadB